MQCGVRQRHGLALIIGRRRRQGASVSTVDATGDMRGLFLFPVVMRAVDVLSFGVWALLY